MKHRLPVWAVTGLGVSYFALWACAPMVAMPGPAPLTADAPNDFGVAGVAVVAHPSPAVGPAHPENLTDFPGGELWYLRRTGPVWDLGVGLSGGTAQFVSAGVLARAHVVNHAQFTTGLQLGIGFLWADAGWFVSGAVAQRIWLYASPTVGARLIAPARLPVGIQLRATEATSISVEGGVGWPASPGTGGTVPFDETQELYWLGLGVDFRF